jgi:RES domain-containing protein
MARDRGGPVPPPPDLDSRKLTLHTVRPKAWWRIYRASFGACYFSEDPSNRFSTAGLGVLYMADRQMTAFWEIFWDELATRPEGERRIARSKLNERQVTAVRPRREFRVFDATDGKSLKAVGAPFATFSGDYQNCQAWARALAAHPKKPEGILYPSDREAGGQCLALFASPTSDCTAFQWEPGIGVADSLEIVASLTDDGVDVLDDTSTGSAP